MSTIDLYVERAPLRFAGATASLESAAYAVLGVPFDSTSSYRPGSRFAPMSIREASINIESNSLTGAGLFIEEVIISDIGDLAVVHGDPKETLRRVESVVGELAGKGVIPIVIGGEHTITAGVARGLSRAGVRPCLLVFDAHLDLREDYLGCKYGHASAIRLAREAIAPDVTIYVGARAYAREELEYAASLGDSIQIISPVEVKKLGPSAVASHLRNRLSRCESVYLSFDIDALDPAYAPGTGTPEPMGLDAFEVFRILSLVVDERFVGMDLVEVNPLVDKTGVTSVLAARILQEFLLLREGRRRAR
ncbi:MAG: agmatinase [Desulfurococcales archaeon]|nr:agmatinase [Desulfurococcales archaeon]